MIKTSASAWRIKASSNSRIAAAPCVSMSIRTSTPLCRSLRIGSRKRSVILAVDLGVLQKFARLDPAQEIRLGKKVIIFALNFAGARRARRAGNGVNKIRRLAERVAKGRLARAGGAETTKRIP